MTSEVQEAQRHLKPARTLHGACSKFSTDSTKVAGRIPIKRERAKPGIALG